MNKRKVKTFDTSELRRRATELIGAKAQKNGKPAPAVDAKVRQELEIHQVELELQNEELRAARSDLEAGLDRYTQLFDFAPIGYATLTANGTVREMNHVGAALLFESRSRLIGKRFPLFVAPADRAEFNELLRLALDTDARETRELELSTVSDERPRVRFTAVSLAGTEPTVLIAFENITAQKRAEERLLRADAAFREADRRKDEFLAVLSHELRTPLSTLLMYGQLLRQGGLEPEKIRMAAEAIERAARVQGRLIDDLLDVSRIVAGKLRMQVDEVNLIAVATAALEAVKKEAERKGIELGADFDDTHSSVLGDAERLQQAMTNLLTNAIKFTPAGGQIRLRIQLLDERVRIQVEDTGSGIDPEFLPHIFKRFSQADRTVTRSTGGLGLGLSIARSIVEAHHGSIRARSSGRGKGSTFTISLPLGTAPRAAVISSLLPPSAGPSRIRGLRLLVVEDDDSTRETLTDVLTMAGAEVRGAAGGAAAMRVLKDFHPDVLVCDIAMPDEDGCALLRRIRARTASSAGNFPALALTAFAGEEDRQRTREAGFETHLVKPVDIDQLITAVSNLLPPGGFRAPSNSN
ncbi:MAG TPA: ATP-binding protein [Polyangiaceae bacterium]|nr:ATP-binding protein [Polyangiaceae bacterium]